MTLPKVLLIGTLYVATLEWNNLSDVAELIHIKDGTRDDFLRDCQSGHYDEVVVILRSEDAYKFTGHFDADLIQYLPRSIKFVCAPQIGYDQIDVNTCTRYGIAVANAPGNVGTATADIAMYLMLGALRRVWVPSSTIRKGQWRGHAGLGHDPEGKILGILGMGNIGSIFAKRAAAFDMHIQYYARHPLPLEKTPPGSKYVSFEELLRTSDVISVHLPLTDSTRHTLSSNEFARMKEGAVLINTSRGSIVDEQALVDALESGKLFSAGLDVFEKEPEIHPKLLENENVVLTPHMGAGTFETLHASETLAISNVRNALQHGTLLTQVREQRAE